MRGVFWSDSGPHRDHRRGIDVTKVIIYMGEGRGGERETDREGERERQRGLSSCPGGASPEGVPWIFVVVVFSFEGDALPTLNLHLRGDFAAGIQFILNLAGSTVEGINHVRGRPSGVCL